MKSKVCCLALALLAACSTSDPGDRPVATWNGITVSKDQFETEYRLYATYAPIVDDEATRRDYALLMLERQIIAELARESKLDTLRIVRETVKRRRDMAARAHLFTTVVKPEVPPVTEEEVREAFRRSNTRILAQQIYAPDRRTADSLHALLVAGADFTTLAQRAMGFDGMMGWVGFDTMDEAPEDVLFAMKQDDVSRPVQSLVGWHIFKAHEIEETVYFDEGTFRNQQQSLRFTMEQRRFDEASAVYQREQVTKTQLATDLRVLQAVYEQLDPLFPTTNEPSDLQRFNSELFFLKPTLSPDTPMAMVDGKPFTIRQFLFQLPDIPYGWVRSNPIEALQIAIRDSILADLAWKTVKPDTARSVKRAVRAAESAALFYAGLQAAADTLTLEHRTETWYGRFKDSHFTSERLSTVETAVFRDSAAAMTALNTYLASASWPSNTSLRTETVRQSTSPDHPANRLRMASRTPLTGPYRTRQGWVLYRLTDQRTEYRTYEEVRPELLALMNERRLQIAQEALLPADYRRQDVILDLTDLDL